MTPSLGALIHFYHLILMGTPAQKGKPPHPHPKSGFEPSTETELVGNPLAGFRRKEAGGGSWGALDGVAPIICSCAPQ